ncbi:hypothetical protein NE237_001775 [Protea cynaroides]|uniref:RRM domain-containing protein n=1 Tax=Protea cynaroides TaxID=273540 RepID=A0A9Q0KU65_9MAGN|nr:hypothetical protein NE237_001775 [Protea cynaroides]
MSDIDAVIPDGDYLSTKSLSPENPFSNICPTLLSSSAINDLDKPRDKSPSAIRCNVSCKPSKQWFMVGMDLSSPDKRLEELNDAQKADGSFSVGKLDLNLAVNKEEGTEAYGHETGAWDDTAPVYLNQKRQHGSPLSPDGIRREESDAFCLESSLSGRTEFDHDEVGEKSFVHDAEGLQSPLKNKHYQGEIGALSDSPSGKSSSPDESEMFQDEKRIEETHHLWESSRTVDSNYQEEEDMEKINIEPSQRYSPLHDEKRMDYSGILSKDSPHEKTESIHDEVDEGASDYHARKLFSPEKMHDNIDKTRREDFYRSSNSPPENGKMEQLHSDLHIESPKITPKRSVSSGRQISVSPESSPYIEKSLRRKPSPPQSDQDPSYSPRSYRKRRAPSLEKLGGDSKRVTSQGNLSPSGQTSISLERRSRQDSQRRGDTSPRRHTLPSGHRRHERSMLRSPVRRRDSSSGYKRDLCDRSRSKSPSTRDHYRRSPRRRYSPRRRSPPSRYHSRRHSPRRRPWSPPPNRNPGVGRPGNNLFVAGFSFVTTERDLERKFSRFGRVRDVRIVRDKRSGDSRGFGFLSLERDEDADAAIRALDQTEWNGRIVLVEKSKTPIHDNGSSAVRNESSMPYFVPENLYLEFLVPGNSGLEHDFTICHFQLIILEYVSIYFQWFTSNSDCFGVCVPCQCLLLGFQPYCLTRLDQSTVNIWPYDI